MKNKPKSFAEQFEDAVNAAFVEFKKEFGEEARLEDEDKFVTIFNNATLVISLEDGHLKTEFIGGEPYQVDMTLDFYEDEGE